ncbi:fatty-acyl-CoA synthase [Bradyrhizobium japonicum]
MLQTRASYVHGVSDEALLGDTIGARFDLAVERWPTNEALVVPHQQVRWTYAGFAEKVNSFAAGLLALGLRPGERVGIWSPNNSEWAVVQFATAKIGLILVTINPAYRVNELEYALTKVGCKALVLATAFKSSDYVKMLRQIAPELDGAQPGKLEASRLPHLKVVIQIGGGSQGMLRFEDVYSLGTRAECEMLLALQGMLDVDDEINIQFTSGTTGSPKGATLTHHNILNNAHFSGKALMLTPADRMCIPVPLYHCFGMVVSNLVSMLYGATLVYPSEGFDPLAVLKEVEREHCTVLYGVPTMFIAEMEHPEFRNFDLSSLRTGIMAGSPCPIEVMRRAIDQMNLREITIGYGMTETSPVTFQSSIDDPIERRVSTVGRVHPNVEAKVVNEHGRIVPRGVSGELLVRGYVVMSRYWADETKTAETIDRAGWLHTGDLATIDASGYCNIVGRLKDMVIRGGENIYPREVEDVLFAHPSIEAVQAFGVPDEKFGEQLCVWIKLRAGEDITPQEVRDFCKDHLAHFKLPHYVKFVDAFPMTISGKARKVEMREQMCRELGLAEIPTA